MTAIVPAVERAYQILNLMAASPHHAFTSAEVATSLGIHRATCFATLKSLARFNLVEWDPNRKIYSLGPEHLRLAGALMDRHQGLQVAREHAYSLAAEFDIGALITVRHGWNMLLTDRIGTDPAFGLPDPRRAYAPIAPPIGGIFLAWSSAEEIDAWISRADPTTTAEELESFRLSVAAIKTRGYSIGSDVELETQLHELLAHLGSGALAERVSRALQLVDQMRVGTNSSDEQPGDRIMHLIGPIFNAEGKVSMAISLFGRPGQIGDDSDGRFQGRLLRACADVTRSAGGIWPEPPGSIDGL